MKSINAVGARKGEKEMALNVGGMDRRIRIMIGIALLALGFMHVVTGTVAIVAYVIGTIALITGAIRFCPAWAIFGINTRSVEHK